MNERERERMNERDKSEKDRKIVCVFAVEQTAKTKINKTIRYYYYY